MYELSIDRETAGALAAAGVHMGTFQRQLTQKLSMEVVAELMARNRVDTGRSRMGWVAPVRRFGGKTPRFSGSQRLKSASKQNEGAGKSKLTVRSRKTSYEVSVENAVDYVVHLDKKYPYIKQGVRARVVKFRREMKADLRAFLESNGRNMP